MDEVFAQFVLRSQRLNKSEVGAGVDRSKQSKVESLMVLPSGGPRGQCQDLMLKPVCTAQHAGQLYSRKTNSPSLLPAVLGAFSSEEISHKTNMRTLSVVHFPFNMHICRGLRIIYLLGLRTALLQQLALVPYDPKFII